jgi:uncharacterized protein (DUF305 family)
MTVLRKAGPALAPPLAFALALGLAGCGSNGKPSAPAPKATPAITAADTDFVLHMLPHHQRAIAVGALAAARGADPRVRDFGRRIVAEQAPEEERLASWVAALHLRPGPGDAMHADGYIDDAALARLRAEPAVAFDRDVLLASAASEAGAARMAGDELAGGGYAPARALATSIAAAPTGEIPQLRELAARLPAA